LLFILTYLSALQRAEIAEIDVERVAAEIQPGFSALQRAEIAEIRSRRTIRLHLPQVSVLFNEPKLLKCSVVTPDAERERRVSVLFNEPKLLKYAPA